jgi:hypothetical protein
MLAHEREPVIVALTESSVPVVGANNGNGVLPIDVKLRGSDATLGTTAGATVRLNVSVIVWWAAAEIGAAAINPLTIAAKPMTRVMGLSNETRLIDDCRPVYSKCPPFKAQCAAPMKKPLIT